MKQLLRTSFALVFSASLLLNSAFAAFDDSIGHEWENSINYLQEQGIVNGDDQGLYNPDELINRAAFTKIIIEAVYGEVGDEYDYQCFNDVPAGEWYTPYICFAAEMEIVNGYTDGSGNFGPTDNITQPAALKVIFNTLNEDIYEIDDSWYYTYLEHAEIIGTLYFDVDDAPESHEITRAEAAYFMAWMISSDWLDQIDYDEFYTYYEYDTAWYDDYEWDDWDYDDDFTFGMTEDECYEDEVYDAELELCYLAYDDDDDWNWDEDNFDWDDWDYDEHEDTDHSHGDDESFAYEIDGDEITLVSNESSTYTEEDYELLWDYFAKVIPEDYRDDITRLEFFSDGWGGTLAAVSQRSDNYEEWILYIDPADSIIDDEIEPDEFPLTVVHEFSHVMSLGADQIPPSYWVTEEDYEEEAAACDTLFFYEGCINEDGYLYEFHQEYWNGQTVEAEGDYWSNPDAYVTAYASTNSTEDFAESFTYFVFQDKPKGSTLAEEKMLFFYQYDELVALRQLIRQRL